jgi:hypothetical protein
LLRSSSPRCVLSRPSPLLRLRSGTAGITAIRRATAARSRSSPTRRSSARVSTRSEPGLPAARPLAAWSARSGAGAGIAMGTGKSADVAAIAAATDSSARSMRSCAATPRGAGWFVSSMGHSPLRRQKPARALRLRPSSRRRLAGRSALRCEAALAGARGQIPFYGLERATGVEPVLRAWKTQHRLLVCSRSVQPRLWNQESTDGSDPARPPESIEDRALVTATVTSASPPDPRAARGARPSALACARRPRPASPRSGARTNVRSC